MNRNSNLKYIIMGMTGTLVVGISHWIFDGQRDFFLDFFKMFPVIFLSMGYLIYFFVVYPDKETCFNLLKQGLSKEEALKSFNESRMICNIFAIANFLLALLSSFSHELESGFIIISIPCIIIPFILSASFNAKKYANKITKPAYGKILMSSKNSDRFDAALTNIFREKEKLKKRIERRKAQREAREALIAEGLVFGDAARRPTIPRDVVDAVWIRDKGRCVYCGSTENLQLDHIIPFSKGGATNVENLQLLCQKCNIKKSNHIGNE